MILVKMILTHFSNVITSKKSVTQNIIFYFRHYGIKIHSLEIS